MTGYAYYINGYQFQNGSLALVSYDIATSTKDSDECKDYAFNSAYADVVRVSYENSKGETIFLEYRKLGNTVRKSKTVVK